MFNVQFQNYGKSFFFFFDVAWFFFVHIQPSKLEAFHYKHTAQLSFFTTISFNFSSFPLFSPMYHRYMRSCSAQTNRNLLAVYLVSEVYAPNPWAQSLSILGFEGVPQVWIYYLH